MRGFEAKSAIPPRNGIPGIGVREHRAPMSRYVCMPFLSIRITARGTLLAGLATVLVGIAMPAAALQVKDTRWFGPVLTDDDGLSVYVVEESPDCINECRVLWTPVPVVAVADADPALKPDLIGSIRDPSGVAQATYGGRPLFYFAEDFVAGDFNGQHFDEFGYFSYLIAPSGAVLDGADGDDCECHLDEVAQY